MCSVASSSRFIFFVDMRGVGGPIMNEAEEIGGASSRNRCHVLPEISSSHFVELAGVDLPSDSQKAFFIL